MTASPNLIGIAAGLVAAALFRSLATNTFLAILLFYLTPLPILLAGIGWGVRSSLVALFSAIVLLGILLGYQSALTFGIYIGLPGVILSYLMHLHREIPQSPDLASGQGSSGYYIEWYPVGQIVAWTAIIAGSLVGLGLLFLTGNSDETYLKLMHAIFDERMRTQLQTLMGPDFGKDEMDHFVERFALFYMPFFASAFWVLLMLGNLWLAAKSAAISGLLHRPVPDLSQIDYPPFLAAGFFAAIGISLTSGMTGVAGIAFLGAISCAFIILGLGIIHILVSESPFRFLILLFLYLGLLIIPWFIPPLILLGLAEPFLRLRQRYAQQSNSNHSQD